MKPLDFTKPLFNKHDGREFIVISDKGPNPDYPFVGYFKGNSYVNAMTLDGSHFKGDEPVLINQSIKRKVEFWVNVDGFGNPTLSLSKPNDEHWPRSMRIACLHFTREYEEGEGL